MRASTGYVHLTTGPTGVCMLYDRRPGQAHRYLTLGLHVLARDGRPGAQARGRKTHVQPTDSLGFRRIARNAYP